MRLTEKIIVGAASLILLMAFVHRLYTRGGPYFAPAKTIVDHVGPGKHETRDALVLLPRVRPLIPRGAEVTCFRPLPNGESDPNDMADYMTAVGQLPHQSVLPPFTAMNDVRRESLVEYVVAIWRPFTNPAYRVVAEFPEGRLYRVER